MPWFSWESHGLVAEKLNYSCIADCCVIIICTNCIFSCLLVIINLILKVEWESWGLRVDCFIKEVEVTDTSYRRFNTLLTNCLALQSDLIWYQMTLPNLRCSTKIFSHNALSKALPPHLCCYFLPTAAKCPHMILKSWGIKYQCCKYCYWYQ